MQTKFEYCRRSKFGWNYIMDMRFYIKLFYRNYKFNVNLRLKALVSIKFGHQKRIF